jgi:hypothetical protein
MSSLLDVYRQLCHEGRLPPTRQKNILTGLRYLAAAHDSAPERFMVTPAVEATYKAVLRQSLTAQGKGPSTITAAIQCVGQFLRARDQLPQATPIPQAEEPGKPAIMTRRQARAAIMKGSPYTHQRWLSKERYLLPRERWPQDIAEGYTAYRGRKKMQGIRESTIDIYYKSLTAYLSYLLMDTETRLGFLPSKARQKLGHELYEDDLNAITNTPTGASWKDLFDLKRVQSYVIWHSWRIHVDDDAKVLKKAPAKPSARGKRVLETMIDIATMVKRADPDDPETKSPEEKALRSYKRGLPKPRRVRDKQADYHRFEFKELEDIALALMEEARHMYIMPATWKRHGGEPYQHPGSIAAARFRTGLILMLAWRRPLRARNWCEALLHTNFIQRKGQWRWYCEGEELKVGKRGQEANKYDVAIPLPVIPYLEEYLRDWRPRFPGAESHRYVFPTRRSPGGQLGEKALYVSLREHAYRFSNKRLFTHLLRTIFYSNNRRDGTPAAIAAHYVGDTTQTGDRYYLEVGGPEYDDIMEEIQARQLNGHRHGNGSSRG